MDQALNTSITISLLKGFYRCYKNQWQKISYLSHNSQSFKVLHNFCKTLKIAFRYSFLGRITEIKQTNPRILDNSQVVHYLINFSKKWKDKISYYSKTSLSTELAKDTKKELYFSTVQTVSLIIFTTILVNMFLTFMLQRQIDLWAWLILGLFLFAGISGLSCQVDWPSVKGSSIFLKRMQRNEKD